MRILALALAVLFLAPLASAQIGHPETPVVDVVHQPATAEQDLLDLAAVNPDYADVRSFGQSVLGMDLWLIDIHAPDVDVDAVPVLYIDGNHHGNEQYGSETVWFFLEDLMEWSTTEAGAERLAEVRVVAAPHINPDGTATNKRTNTNNVDLNRNYPYHWGLYGTSDTPAGLNYRGESPASEPETQANVALMDELRPDVYLSTHTGSHDIVLPWRQTGDPNDGPIPDWSAYARFLEGIEEVSGLGYRDPSGAGESISYAYGAHGAISLIPEVDTTQFQPVSAEDLRALLEEEIAIMDYALTVLEFTGGYLQARDGHLYNDGWGNATNVTWYGPDALDLDGFGGDGQRVVDALPDGGSRIAERVQPGGSVHVPQSDGIAVYERRQQGDEGLPLWAVQVQDQRVIGGDHDDQGTPFPALAAVAGLLAVALWAARRRRAA